VKYEDVQEFEAELVHQLIAAKNKEKEDLEKQSELVRLPGNDDRTPVYERLLQGMDNVIRPFGVDVEYVTIGEDKKATTVDPKKWREVLRGTEGTPGKRVYLRFNTEKNFR